MSEFNSEVLNLIRHKIISCCGYMGNINDTAPDFCSNSIISHYHLPSRYMIFSKGGVLNE